jgi:hypothetical protein
MIHDPVAADCERARGECGGCFAFSRRVLGPNVIRQSEFSATAAIRIRHKPISFYLLARLRRSHKRIFPMNAPAAWNREKTHPHSSEQHSAAGSVWVARGGPAEKDQQAVAL